MSEKTILIVGGLAVVALLFWTRKHKGMRPTDGRTGTSGAPGGTDLPTTPPETLAPGKKPKLPGTAPLYPDHIFESGASYNSNTQGNAVSSGVY